MVMKLPEDFVYLKEINPNIIADLQFLLHENFVGSRIKGYHSNEVFYYFKGGVFYSIYGKSKPKVLSCSLPSCLFLIFFVNS